MLQLGKRQILMRPLKKKIEDETSNGLVNEIAECVKVVIKGKWNELRLENGDSVIDFNGCKATIKVDIIGILKAIGIEYFDGVKWDIRTK